MEKIRKIETLKFEAEKFTKKNSELENEIDDEF